MRKPTEIKEIGRSLLFIYSKEDDIEIGWTGAHPNVRAINGKASQEEIAEAKEVFLSHPVSNY